MDFHYLRPMKSREIRKGNIFYETKVVGSARTDQFTRNFWVCRNVIQNTISFLKQCHSKIKPRKAIYKISLPFFYFSH